MKAETLREFHLVSAPFSCGISWAVSVLLELGIRTTHAEPRRYRNGFWRPAPDAPNADSIVPEGVAHMRYYLPLLHERNAFQFEPGVEVFWEHRLDSAREIHRPVILFTRDPRDAIHSLYQRNYRHFGWLEYLRRPDRWQDHFPEMFGLPPAETWAAWHAFWLGLESLTPVKVVRFEDSKLRPLETAREILGWLGVERSDAAIRRAVERSSFQKIHAAMTKTETETGQKFGVARRGKPGEWKEFMDSEALQAFGGPAAHWMREIGYEPATESLDAMDLRQLPADARLQPALQARIDIFRSHWLSGRVREAREQLNDAEAFIAQARVSDEERLWVATHRVAFDWTERVLGADQLSTATARAAFSAFQGFNSQFAQWPSVRQMLDERARGMTLVRSDVFGSLGLSASPMLPAGAARSAGPSGLGTPVLVEEDYKGYRLVGFGGRFYAVAREANDIDLSRISPEEMSSRRAQGKLFAGDLGFEVKEAIDRFMRAP